MTTTQESKHSLLAKVNYEKKTISLDGNKLTINDIKLLKSDVLVEISPLAKKKMIKANEYVKEIIESGEAVYGINTGFGALADKKELTRKIYQNFNSI